MLGMLVVRSVEQKGGDFDVTFKILLSMQLVPCGKDYCYSIYSFYPEVFASLMKGNPLLDDQT